MTSGSTDIGNSFGARTRSIEDRKTYPGWENQSKRQERKSRKGWFGRSLRRECMSKTIVKG